MEVNMNRFEFFSNLNEYKKKQDELKHYGIIGQKWGKRRWQNPDGTFNEAGKERYFGKKSNDEKIESMYSTAKAISNLFPKKRVTENGEQYDERYQNRDGSLTQKGKKLLEKKSNKLNLEMYEKYKEKYEEKRNKEREEKIKKENEIKERIKSLDNEITTDKYPKNQDKLTDEEFDKIASDLEQWKEDFYNNKTNKHLNTLVADLGINAMNKARGYSDAEVGNNNDREWFMYEDQTLGLPEIAYLYVNGYSKDYIKGMLNYKEKIYDLPDEEYNKLDEKYPHAMFTIREFHDGNQYIDGLFELKESNQKIGSKSNKNVKDEETLNKEKNQKIFEENVNNLKECEKEYGYDNDGYKRVKTKTAGKVDFTNSLNRNIFDEAEHEIEEVPSKTNKLRKISRNDIKNNLNTAEDLIKNFDKNYDKALNEVVKLYYETYTNNVKKPMSFNDFKNSINIFKGKNKKKSVYLENINENTTGYSTFIYSKLPGNFSAYLIFNNNGEIYSTGSFAKEYRKIHIDP